MKYILILFLIILVGCGTNEISLTKGESVFLERLFKRNPDFMKGQHLIFITNKSECGPCEEKVLAFYAEDFGKISKTFVVSPDQKYTRNWSDTIQYSYRDLASYGLISSSGSILVLKEGTCVFSELIEVPALDQMKLKIQKIIQTD